MREQYNLPVECASCRMSDKRTKTKQNRRIRLRRTYKTLRIRTGHYNHTRSIKRILQLIIKIVNLDVTS